ncbi:MULTISPECIES: chromosomal replication initiator protein DnaA [Tepidanaerobacter]|uniref:Chromosomal replication initiator protein DnaA n=1 Tax=Tepidanaerobacter syntrophicus TaxID=224999 RepID=A0A0U9HDU9_9FIRM|nr:MULTISPECIES: chromosomal replication initiator protein DnaA [Tepidanaerobacter]GAQ24861.1 chromosomal replication initiator protein [Tepidanaerobacter syntrophicus]GLI18871.1 chromosomal replication initiator protein DnaA [Tepidanaerobacter syntrophicus]GLI51273.1 chromosomal replication initiator protein DnaA [Tepidanaerobacter syntrophicus]HHV83205.1 chromosomal replication initiator protein DnaA [Tepidanaerobacter syntrophicus]
MSGQVDPLQLWQHILKILSNELNNDMSFNTVLKPSRLATLDDGRAVIEVPNDFIKSVIERRYLNLIKDIFNSVLKQNTSVEVRINPTGFDSELVQENLPISDDTSEVKAFSDDLTPSLNQKYTFDTFVVGNSNRFAHAASQAVAESPAKAYNPFFIYGGVGLGKTHLMHAIGHYILQRDPNCKVVYLSSEKFTNELINSIRDDKNVEFRNKYRTIDVLLIDDIQFIAGKERTQEEFFHTFNALHDANKQLVISSDRPPKEIPTLEERLRSRFEWGLITDIQPPDFETRIAILQKKAMMENLIVPDDVINFIATKIETNIRELEGALIRVVAYSSLTNCPIDMQLAEQVLKDLIPNGKPKQVTSVQIVKEVGNYFSINPEDFKSKKRTKDLAFARQVAMYLCCELTDLSLPKIGEEFGGRDHTTVIHARDKITSDMQQDIQLLNAIESIKKKILYS